MNILVTMIQINYWVNTLSNKISIPKSYQCLFLTIEQCEKQVATVIGRYFDIKVIKNDEHWENLPHVVRTIFEHHPKIKSPWVYILQKKKIGRKNLDVEKLT